MAVSASPMQVADERDLLTDECHFDIARKRSEEGRGTITQACYD
jgi:hypothetical protein